MKIILEIPKEFEVHFDIDKFEDSLRRLSADAHSFAGNYEKEFANMLIDAFRNSTLLPKGHGRLIDAENLFGFILHHTYPIRYDCNSIEQGMSMTGINQCINESPTIIEADTGEE